jgi:hypothetical protein
MLRGFKMKLLVFSMFAHGIVFAQMGSLTMNEDEFDNFLLESAQVSIVLDQLGSELKQGFSVTYMKKIKQIARYISNLDSKHIAADKKYNDILSVISRGLTTKIEWLDDEVATLPIMRDLSLLLMNQQITDIQNLDAYEIVRSAYSNALVTHYENLRQEQIKDFQQLPVYVNVPFSKGDWIDQPLYSGMDPSDIKDEKLRKEYEAAIEENKLNELINRKQIILQMNIDFLRERIEEYLRFQFGHKPDSQDELDKCIARLGY